MNKTIASALGAAVLMALPGTAAAEVLDYDFEMPITSISDGYGVFEGLSVGDTINVSVQLDTAGDGDGTVNVQVAEVTFSNTGSWSSSWDDVQYNGNSLSWDAYSGMVTGGLQMNGVGIDHAVSYHQELYLTFGESSPGEMALLSGELELRLENGSSARLNASYDGTSVPELDAKSGGSAVALVAGGVALALARRREDDEAAPRAS